jgi:hypothetical protein
VIGAASRPAALRGRRAGALAVAFAAAVGAGAAAVPGARADDPSAVIRLDRAFGDGRPFEERMAAARAVVLEDTPEATAAVCRALAKTHAVLDRLAEDRRKARAEIPLPGRKGFPGSDPRGREAEARAAEIPERSLLAILRKALGAIREPRAATVLERMAGGGAPDPRVRAEAAVALPRALGGAAVPALRAVLGDRDWRVRAAAVEALAAVPVGPAATDAETAILQALDDADFGVRLVAARALAARPSATGVDRIVARMAMEEGRVAREFGGLLCAMTGQNFGSWGDAWARWWKEAREAYAKGVARLSPADGPVYRAGPAAETAPGERLSYHGITVETRRVLFVLDISASMSSVTGEATRLDQARRELVRVVRTLDPGASFGLVAYNDRVDPWKSALAKAAGRTKEEAATWAGNLEPAGTTNTYGAMEEAFRTAMTGEISYGGGADTIFLLTDGAPTAPPGPSQGSETQAIVDAVGRWNAHRRVVVHCVAAGSGADRSFLGRLAAANGGEMVSVE